MEACTKVMYIWSISGRSSRSTSNQSQGIGEEPLILTKSALSKSATSCVSKDSRSMTYYENSTATKYMAPKLAVFGQE